MEMRGFADGVEAEDSDSSTFGEVHLYDGIDFLIAGILPGAGASLGSFISYSMEKRLVDRAGTFGKGDPRGVAAPEAGNNAAADNREPEIGRWHPVFHWGLRRYRFSRIPENGYPIRKRSQTAGFVTGRSCFAISEVVDYLY